MKLSFHGADLGVTGSCHLIECAGTRILIDCGLFQGGRELDEENEAPFGFNAADIDFVLLTHAHLDHCGRLPLLAKRGFRGTVISTSATRDLARIVLLDSAHLQESEAEYHNKKGARRGEEKHYAPLYNTHDVLHSLDQFTQIVRYDHPVQIASGITATWIDAGHILGSASIVLDLNEAGKRCRLVFSGDLGSDGRKLLRDPAIPPKADVVVMETTYGDRLHKPLDLSIDELYGAIVDTFRRGGNVVIPTFALERTQEILYYLHEGVTQGKLPRSMQVFLDSPMAISATELFRQHSDCCTENAAALLQGKADPFQVPGLHFCRDAADSMAINQFSGGAVIMAGAGMCTGGRIRHHLKHNLWRQNASIVFVGFASVGTLARKIIDGARTVRVLGEDIAVKANIYTINGFSAHADRDELLAWHNHTHATHTFLVHGEEEVMRSFAQLLPAGKVSLPQTGYSVDLATYCHPKKTAKH
ncbi:MBL fold metallo-hydrolase [Undibacterium sp. 14-3-2]|uniref:MBL fold metallo-hydrolase RNA specificity domain-containing protein n=1 Tax=Undibacterium sp. 14-3-2 TaxID=2800129 RepID=UPI001906BCE5|nr:MBL fold metallo-hydrolase [Undibacterium sp. 14-3-2]MBK1889103.1 MBL fold metallo-hydrolase [Undibacterium sp. 14-3-2]